jgi:hypothetical protein
MREIIILMTCHIDNWTVLNINPRLVRRVVVMTGNVDDVPPVICEQACYTEANAPVNLT